MSKQWVENATQWGMSCEMSHCDGQALLECLEMLGGHFAMQTLSLARICFLLKRLETSEDTLQCTFMITDSVWKVIV